MKISLEREFKTGISETSYLNLIKEYQLEDKRFLQINYYFDTDNLDLLKNDITLRIRQKGNQYKITAKITVGEGKKEISVYLDEDKAKEMLEAGFDANIVGINHFVKKVAELETLRVKMPYKEGFLFFDKSTYSNKVDYEIEYEINDGIPYEKGKEIFNEFLKEKAIPFVKLIGKSTRAYKEKGLQK